MRFLEEYKDEYESPVDNLAKDFIVPGLKECKVYRRETAWFKSSALRAWAESLKHIVNKKDIKIEILAYPKIDMTTYWSLKATQSDEMKKDIIRSYREKIILNAIDFENKSEIHTKETGRQIGQLLSYLIAQGKLEIRFIQLGHDGVEILDEDNEEGLSHIKRGYFEFEGNTVLAFNGSANESHGGLMKQGEYMMVFDSRLEKDIKRAFKIKKRFDDKWDGKAEGVITEPISKELLKKIKTFAPRKAPVINISSTSNQNPENTNELPNWLWNHQKDAIKAFMSNKKGILEMATGTGKTSTALEIANQLIKNNSVKKIIICATEKRALLYQWVDELYEWIDNNDHKDIHIFKSFDGKNESIEFINFDKGISIMVASRRADVLGYLFKNCDDHKTLIIQDEVHGMGAVGLLKLKGLQKNFRYTLGLSATPERGFDEIGTDFIYEEIGKPIYKFGLVDAIKNNILCPFNYHTVDIELSENDNKRYQNIRASYEHSKTTNKPWTEEMLATQLARVKNLAEDKPDAFSDFIQRNRNLIKSSIIFCAEWSQADRICKELVKVSTSFIRMDANSKSEQINAIANFGKDSDCIVTCDALSEGVDIRSLNNIFLLSANKLPLQTIQRIGRCIRKNPDNPDKIANVIDFIVYRSLSDSNVIKADEDRMTWISEIAKVRPNE